MTTSLEVALAGRSYDILIGRHLLGDAGRQIRTRFGARKLIVVTDETVAPLYLDTLTNALTAAELEVAVVTVPAGEQSKELQRFPDLCERLLDAAPERRSLLIALGGGVVGDLTGFAAASLLRGIDFVQIPTTLLAQIDSSVGGKTGVNTRQGKNLIGAFHQPRLVLADLDTLATLPARELASGYAEMIKYGVLGDADFFAWLEGHGAAILALDAAALESAVAHCCRMKAEIVAEDEREHGRRALLNLGHTFGHALEAETGFGDLLLHGESVALGMVLAAELSARLDRCAPSDALRVQKLVAAAGLPIDLRGLGKLSAKRLLAHMAHDKKVEDGLVTFILLDGLGKAVPVRGISSESILALLEDFGAI